MALRGLLLTVAAAKEIEKAAGESVTGWRGRTSVFMLPVGRIILYYLIVSGNRQIKFCIINSIDYYNLCIEVLPS